MPNIKSAKKRVIVAELRRQKNAAEKSAVKTAIKKYEAAIKAGEKEQAATLLTAAISRLDKAGKKGVYHKNAISRQKSRLTKIFNHA